MRFGCDLGPQGCYPHLPPYAYPIWGNMACWSRAGQDSASTPSMQLSTEAWKIQETGCCCCLLAMSSLSAGPQSPSYTYATGSQVGGLTFLLTASAGKLRLQSGRCLSYSGSCDASQAEMCCPCSLY